MEPVELLTVEDTFWLARGTESMLVLRPDFSVPKNGWKNQEATVTVVKPDGQRLEANAELSMSHFNISDPEVSIDRRWRIVVWLTDKTKQEVPICSKIMAPRTIRDRLVNLPI